MRLDTRGLRTAPLVDIDNSEDFEFYRDQLDTLAEAIELKTVKTTRAQMARLLRQLTKGKDWRHGAWK